MKMSKQRRKIETSSTNTQQIILDAVNILQIKIANLTQKINELIEDASKL